MTTSFLNLLSSTEHPSAPQLRSAFLPALTGSDVKPRDPSLAHDLDRQILDFLLHPPAVTLLQAVLSSDQIDNAWKAGAESPMMNMIVLSFPLHQELERAKSEGQQEEVANLNSERLFPYCTPVRHAVLNVKSHEDSDDHRYGGLRTCAVDLRQGVRDRSAACRCSLTYRNFSTSRQVHGYRYPDAYSETASLHTTNTRASASSLQSNGSILVQARNKDDVGFRAVMALLGCDYELLTYAIGMSELVSCSLAPAYKSLSPRRAATGQTPFPNSTLGFAHSTADLLSDWGHACDH